METVVFDAGLKIFQNIILLYRDDSGNLFVGNTYYYGGRGDKENYLSVMYKDPLPKDRNILDGWNYLDDYSPRIILVPEQNIQTGVEDFLYAHNMPRDWHTIEYHIIESFGEIDPYVESHPIGNGQVVAFGIKF